MSHHVVIIGNGIAGTTAARYIRKRSDHSITVISAESDHFFSRTALMYIYMGHMTYENTKPYEDWFWDKNRIHLMRAYVERVDTQNKAVQLSGGQKLPYDTLIIASGSKSNKFGWPGQDLRGVQGLYSIQDLEQMEKHTRGIERGVVVGGGLIGIETAEMLHSRHIPVSLLVRERSWMERVFPAEESAMINEEIRDHGIDLRLATELDHVLGDADGAVRGAVTKDRVEIPCQFLALTVGVSPNIDFLQGSGIECDRGVLVNEHLETSAAGVFAIGDCVQVREPGPGRRPIEAVWYVGRIMGQTVAQTITGKRTAYAPGVWYNSAKFFDLEWQIYGDVPAQPPEGHETLFWQEARRSIRINYRRDTQAVTGFNLMGIRYRHDVCERWLREAWPIDRVLTHLGAANFDPELCPQSEAELVACYNKQNPGRELRLEQRRGLRGALGLLATAFGSGAAS